MPQGVAMEDGRILRINGLKVIALQGITVMGLSQNFVFLIKSNDDVPCANASPDWSNFLIPISTYGRWVPDGSVEDRNAIKTQIMESGPVVDHHAVHLLILMVQITWRNGAIPIMIPLTIIPILVLFKAPTIRSSSSDGMTIPRSKWRVLDREKQLK